MNKPRSSKTGDGIGKAERGLLRRTLEVVDLIKQGSRPPVSVPKRVPSVRVRIGVDQLRQQRDELLHENARLMRFARWALKRLTHNVNISRRKRQRDGQDDADRLRWVQLANEYQPRHVPRPVSGCQLTAYGQGMRLTRK